MSKGLQVRGITRRFATQVAVRDVSFDVLPKEIVALVGASGSGKTTTLRMVAGYEIPDEGRILLDGKDITQLPPEKRGFGMVFQHYALFPHMTVLDNVAFGLEARGVAKKERYARAMNALEIVGLQAKSDRRVQQLSGGEQQRVALARAVVFEPKVLLLDEPLSNLDPTLRESTREELKNIIHRVGAPALFVTHDQEDAFAIADKVVLIGKGSVLQIDTPEQLYKNPQSAEVAKFIGKASLVPIAGGRMLVLRPEDLSISALDSGDLLHVSNQFVSESAALATATLEQTEIGGTRAWQGEVLSRRFASGNYVYIVEALCKEAGVPGDGSRVLLEVNSPVRYEVGQAVVLKTVSDTPTIVSK